MSVKALGIPKLSDIFPDPVKLGTLYDLKTPPGVLSGAIARVKLAGDYMFALTPRHRYAKMTGCKVLVATGEGFSQRVFRQDVVQLAATTLYIPKVPAGALVSVQGTSGMKFLRVDLVAPDILSYYLRPEDVDD